MKIQPVCIIYPCHQNSINISLYAGVELKPAATELKLQTGPETPGYLIVLQVGHGWGVWTDGITSQRASAHFNPASPMRMMMEV